MPAPRTRASSIGFSDTRFGRGSTSLPKRRQSTAISVGLKGVVAALEPVRLQVLLIPAADFAHNSGR
jgi:hypothetical protein